MVFANPLLGIADEADGPRREIIQTAKPIKQFTGQSIGIERIDGEIAACGIVLPILRKGYRGAASVGRNIMAQRGDFGRPAGQDGSDRAVINPGRDDFDGLRLEPPYDLARLKRGCDVDIFDRQPQQGIAHRTTNIAGILRAKCCDQAAQILALHPWGIGRKRDHHAILFARLTIIPAVTPQIRCSCHIISV